MNEETEFNLVYYHKETGEMYRVKKTSRHDCMIYDPRTKTKLPLSKHFLDKSFKADKENAKRQKKVRLNFRNFKKRENSEA